MIDKTKPMLNEALRLIRAFHDTKQTDLARKLGISRSYLSEIEAGKKEPTLDLLYRYADVFNVPVSSLMLFCESLDHPRQSDKPRLAAANKILKLLQWVEAKSESQDGEAA